MVDESGFILCPVCGCKTRIKVRPDTVIINFPLFCPKCKQESNIDVKDSSVIFHGAGGVLLQ
jgi:hypothetical protein